MQCYNSVDLKQTRRIPEHKGGSLVPQGLLSVLLAYDDSSNTHFFCGKNPILLGTAAECLLHGTCISTSSIKYVHLPVLLDDFERLKNLFLKM